MSDPDRLSAGDLASRLFAAYLAGIPVPERPASLEEVRDLLDLHLQTGLATSGQASVGVTPGPEGNREGLVLTIVADDMPQLVRSVLGAIADVGAHATRLLHPVIQAHRDANGRLLDAEPAVLGQTKGRRESWICVTVTGARDADELAHRVRQALAEAADVRRDNDKMNDQLRMAAENLRHVHPDHEGAALLAWMATGNVTILTTVAHPSPDRAADKHILGVARLAGDPDPGPAHEPVRGITIRHVPTDLIWAQQHPLLEFGVRLSDDRLLRFICFLLRSGRTANVATTPVLRGVSQAVLTTLQAPVGSYTAGELLGVLDRLPRTILLTLPTTDIVEMVRDTGTVSIRRQVHTRLFRTPDRRTAIVLVLLPRDRYIAGSAPRIAAAVEAATNRPGLVAADHRSEAPTATVTVTFPVPANWDAVAAETVIRTSIDEIFRSWPERLARRLFGDHPADPTRLPFNFDAGYQLDRSIDDAVRDLTAIEALSDEDSVEVVLKDLDISVASATVDLFSGRDLTLSDILPVIQNLGVRVVEQRAYRVAGRTGRPARLYSLSVELPHRGVPDSLAERFTAAFLALWSGAAELDGFNAIITHSELTWSDVAVLRAYSRYASQLGSPHGPASLARIVLDHPGVAADLVKLFRARFDPSLHPVDRDKRAEVCKAEINLALDQIVSLDTDRGLRLLMNLILATERTNAFTDPARTIGWHPLAVKITPGRLPEVPQPVPDREIWVYDPTFEGVHLRFGPIARGGLRWSDRPADFRTEILGLVKAQEVKNAVIIPVGAKGGFVLRAAPKLTGDPAADRTALQAAGRTAYRAFIGALLDLTDNRPDDTVVAPPGVVRHDGDDPYLVVAADKGTATFSDLANQVAEECGFWLGDAFASGGSAGYDHKAMGITARGAWESVRYHFAEIGVDVQTDDITCVGIGDMSGDVFGNGMLLSPHLRLVAAFDHRHIFVDPDPNTAAAAQERRRLFDLPGSSWAAFDPSLISAGGGVWARSSKAIPVSAQMRTALGLSDTVAVMTPPELIRAILTAPVDLLWNGGIGTYVKASAESHLDAADRANDQVRVNAAELRVRVVGEGGNLGFTQRARVEFAQKGGRIRTDAIDNSAGVDTSDHEVNIKIAVRQAIANGDIASADRSLFLASLTDDIAEAVLTDNVAQNRVLAVAELAAPHQVEVYARLLDRLEAQARVRRDLDALPSTAQLRSRSSRGLPLTSPELSLVLAHVKSQLTEELAGLDIWDSPPVRRAVEHYFPPALRTASPASIRQHPLAPQIAATVIANQVVNHGGLTYVHRLCEEAGCTAADAARAFLAVTEIFDLPRLWDRIWNPSTPMPTRARHELILASLRLLDRASRWMLLNRQRPLDLTLDPAHFRPRVAELLPGLGLLLRPSSQRLVEHEVDRLVKLGAPHAEAEQLSQLLYAYTFLDIVNIASTINRSVTQVADVYFGLGERLGVDTLLAAVAELPRRDRWEALARRSLRDQVFATLRAATNDLFNLNQDFPGTEASISRWAEARAARLAAVDSIRDEILTGGSTVELAALSVLTARFATIAT